MATQAPRRPRGGIDRCRSKTGAVALGDDDPVGAAGLRRADDGAQVVGILDAVADDHKKGLLPGTVIDVPQFCVGGSRTDGGDPLVGLDAGELGELFPGHFLYRDARLLCHAENGRYRTVFLLPSGE